MAERHQREERQVKLEKGLANPNRADILAKLNECPNSAVDIGRELGLPRQTVNYHIGYLLDLDCIEEIDQVQGKRGALKKIYRAIETMYIGPETWRELPLHARNGISLNIVAEGAQRAQAALAEGTFDKRKNRIAGNWSLRLDEEGWQEAFEMLMPVIERFKVMQSEAIERTPDHLERFPFTFTLLAYESPPKGCSGRTGKNPPHE
jgi:DNA-binding transcriptional ArsR family regulator